MRFCILVLNVKHMDASVTAMGAGKDDERQAHNIQHTSTYASAVGFITVIRLQSFQ